MGILICGLNGTGKSTLGKMLADRLGYEFIDNEDLCFPVREARRKRSGFWKRRLAGITGLSLRL